MKTAFVLGLAVVLAGCDDEEEERRELEAKKAWAAAQTSAAQRAALGAAAAAKAQASLAAKNGPAPARVPTELGKVPAPVDNPTTEAKVALGQRLFFEPRLSADGSRSCYSCHQNEDGNGGKEPLAIGAKNKKLTRHSPVIWNVGYLPNLHWDGRAPNLEKLSLGAWSGPAMGVGEGDLAEKASAIGALPEYAAEFKAVFPDQGATPDTVAKALAAYQRTLVCDDTAYDRFAKGDQSALTDQQKHGHELFMGKAGCASCHAPPFFSIAYLGKQGAFFNTGVGVDGKKEQDVDVGRMAVTGNDADWAAFKPPSLRNVAKSAPYFHDGSVKTLDQAVRFMARGGHPNKNLSPLLTDKQLADSEISALVQFLGSLDCQNLELPKPAASPGSK